MDLIKKIKKLWLGSSEKQAELSVSPAATAPEEPAGYVVSHPVTIPRSEHNISRSHIADNALKVLYRLHKAGYQACLVGGGVRDLLLGLEPKDFDVATDARPEEVGELFRNCRLIGRRFRLAHVHFGQEIIEVATFRGGCEAHTEVVQDESGRILRDNVYGNIEQDAWRRDFTANALFYDIGTYSIIDYVGAMQDVRNRVLRMIGDPQTRYREDPVRMLRAVRFAAKLGFTIHEDTEKPIRELAPLLSDMPQARLYEEVLKLFHSGSSEKSLELLRHYGLFEYLFPLTEKCLREDKGFERFVHLALQSTDQRMGEDKPVNPAFLIAVFLWAPVRRLADELAGRDRLPPIIALQNAAAEIISQQSESVAIPRRNTMVARDMWLLQPRFRNRNGRRARAVLGHPKFRAAYDFLCLRNEAGEELEEICGWWTEIQTLTPEQQDRVFKGGSLPRAPRSSQSSDDPGSASQESTTTQQTDASAKRPGASRRRRRRKPRNRNPIDGKNTDRVDTP